MVQGSWFRVHGSGVMVQGSGALMVKDKSIFVACADEWLELTEVQLAGKKRMSARDFLNGMKGLDGSRVK